MPAKKPGRPSIAPGQRRRSYGLSLDPETIELLRRWAQSDTSQGALVDTLVQYWAETADAAGVPENFDINEWLYNVISRGRGDSNRSALNDRLGPAADLAKAAAWMRQAAYASGQDSGAPRSPSALRAALTIAHSRSRELLESWQRAATEDPDSVETERSRVLYVMAVDRINHLHQIATKDFNTMLTPEKARIAFQNAIPRMRQDFARRVRARLRSIAHENQYALAYPNEVLEMAQQEMRSRIALAATRVKALLDSGWRPDTQTTIRTTFLEMFNGFDHWEKDPRTDLEHAVENSFSDVGRHEPAAAQSLKLALGKTQVEAMNEHESDLEFYLSERRGSKITINNNAPVSAQFVGNENTANIIGNVDVQLISNASSAVRTAIANLPQNEGDEISEHLSIIDGELTATVPKKSRIRASFAAIGRIVQPLAATAAKTLVESSVSGVVKGLVG